MYSGVPNTAPWTVSAISSSWISTFAMPKSRTFTKSYDSSRSVIHVLVRRHADEVASTGLLEQHDVVGLEVAMDHADGVRGIERERDLVRDVQRAVQLDRAFLLDQILERLALEVLHDEVDRAFGQDAEVGDVDDVRMVDRRRRARLAQEAVDRFLIARELRVQHFHRDGLLDVDVLAEIDGAHAAATEDLVEAVVADVVAEPRDVLFFDEDRGVVQTEALPVGETREAARADFHLPNLDCTNSARKRLSIGLWPSGGLTLSSVNSRPMSNFWFGENSMRPVTGTWNAPADGIEIGNAQLREDDDRQRRRSGWSRCRPTG